MRIRSFALYMMAILLCLSSGSCKRDLAPEEQKENLEVPNECHVTLREDSLAVLVVMACASSLWPNCWHIAAKSSWMVPFRKSACFSTTFGFWE